MNATNLTISRRLDQHDEDGRLVLHFLNGRNLDRFLQGNKDLVCNGWEIMSNGTIVARFSPSEY